MEPARAPRTGDIRRFFQPRQVDPSSHAASAASSSPSSSQDTKVVVGTAAGGGTPGAGNAMKQQKACSRSVTPHTAGINSSGRADSNIKEPASSSQKRKCTSESDSSSSSSSSSKQPPHTTEGVLDIGAHSGGTPVAAAESSATESTLVRRHQQQQQQKKQKDQVSEEKGGRNLDAKRQSSADVNKDKTSTQVQQHGLQQHQSGATKVPQYAAFTTEKQQHLGQGGAVPSGSSKKTWRRLRRGGEASDSSDGNDEESIEDIPKKCQHGKKSSGDPPRATTTTAAAAEVHSPGSPMPGNPTPGSRKRRLGDGKRKGGDGEGQEGGTPSPRYPAEQQRGSGNDEGEVAVLKGEAVHRDIRESLRAQASTGKRTASENRSHDGRCGTNSVGKKSTSGPPSSALKEEVTDIDAFFAAALEEDFHKAKRGSGLAKHGSTPSCAPVAAGVNTHDDTHHASKAEKKTENNNTTKQTSEKDGGGSSSSNSSSSCSSNKQKPIITGEAKEWAKLLDAMAPSKVRSQQQRKTATTTADTSSEDGEGDNMIEEEEREQESKTEREGPTSGGNRKRLSAAGGGSGRQQGGGRASATTGGKKAMTGTRRSKQSNAPSSSSASASSSSSDDDEFVVSSGSSSSPSDSSSEEEEEEFDDEEDNDEEDEEEISPKKRKGVMKKKERTAAKTKTNTPQKKKETRVKYGQQGQESTKEEEKEAVTAPMTGVAAHKGSGGGGPFPTLRGLSATAETSPAEKKRTQNSNSIDRGKSKEVSSKLLPFEGKTFVFTGVLDSFGRDEAAETVVRLGGRCTSAVSGRTDYLVMGGVLEDGREVTSGSKYRKAIQLQQQQQLRCSNSSSSSTSNSGGSSSSNTPSSGPAKGIEILNEAQFLALLPPVPLKKPGGASPSAGQQSSRALNFPAAVVTQAAAATSQVASKSDSGTCIATSRPTTSSLSTEEVSGDASSSPDLLWAEKYRPSCIDELVGNREQLRTLQTWLADWKDPQLNLNARAALLSGPPGIGKTTAARIAAKEAGFTVIELNASDTRNKSHIEGLGDMVTGGRSLHMYFPMGKYHHHHHDDATAAEGGRHASKAEAPKQQQQSVPMGDVCLVMDEVDGLSGGDRGGSQAIIKLMENSKCPLICICNDRMHPKVRTLGGKCLDLRFSQPHKGAIRQRVAAIAAAENLPLDATSLDYLVEAGGGDMRQILNNMQLLSYDMKAKQKKDSTGASSSSQLQTRDLGIKDEQVLYGPFECCKQLLDAHQAAGLSLVQKIDRFFVDYDMLPLLIQENYIEAFRQGLTRGAASAPSPVGGGMASPFFNAPSQQRRGAAGGGRRGGGGGGGAGGVRGSTQQQPQQQQQRSARGEAYHHQQQQQQHELAMRLTAAAAVDISEADMMNTVLRTVQQLPTAGVARVQFPSWLGRNSTQTKHKRLLTELLLLLMRKPSCCSTTNGLKLTGYLDALYEKCLAPLVQQKQLSQGAGKSPAATALANASKEKAIEQTLHEMDVYGLTRDMLLENIQCLRLKSEPSLYDRVDTKTKTAFTRTYNSSAARKGALVSTVMKKKKRDEKTPSAALQRESGMEPGEEGEEAEDDEEEDDAGDFMILKRTNAKLAKNSSSSSGRGGGGVVARKRSRGTGAEQKATRGEGAETNKRPRSKKSVS